MSKQKKIVDLNESGYFDHSDSNGDFEDKSALSKRFEQIKDLHEVINQTSIENALYVLEAVEKHGTQDFDQLVTQVLNKYGGKIIEADAFLHTTHTVVTSLLQSDLLSASEMSIFQASCKWATTQMKCKHLECTPENLRNQLQDILSLIRFPLMHPDEFVLLVTSKEILTAEEVCDILKYMSVSDELKFHFTSKYFSNKKRLWTFENPANHKLQLISGEIALQEILQKGGNEISLKQCSVDLNALMFHMSSMKLSCRQKIHSVSISNVVLLNEDSPISGAVRLPNLKTFSLTISTCTLSDDLFHSVCNQFTKYLFVSRSGRIHPVPWPISKLWQSNVNLFLSINKIVLLKIDHEEGSVVLNNLCRLSLALRGMSLCEKIKSLAISFRPQEAYETCVLSSVDSVSILILHDLYHLNKDQFDAFLQGFSNITKLVLYNCGYLEIDFTVLITKSEKLCELAVSHARFKTRGVYVQFIQLRKLSLWNCHWEEEFDMLNLFPNVSHLSIYTDFVLISLHKVLEAYLNSKELKRLVVSGYLWGVPFDRDEQQRKQDERSFFKRFGELSKRYGSFSKMWTNERWEEMNDNDVLGALFQQFHFHFFREINNT